MPFDMNTGGRSSSALTVTAVACVALHLLLAPHVSLFGGRFNFMLVLVVASAIAGDSRTMVYVGFLAGLLFDLTTAAPVGLMSFLLAVTGYGVALLSRGLTGGLGMETLRVAAVAVLGVHLVYALALFALGVEGSIVSSIGVQLVSGVLDMAACALPLALGARSGNSTFSGRGRGLGGKYSGTRLKGLK